MKTLVLVEHDGAQIKDATLAAVTAAAKLGEVHLLVAAGNEGVGGDAAKIAGVQKVHVATAAHLEHQRNGHQRPERSPGPLGQSALPFPPGPHHHAPHHRLERDRHQQREQQHRRKPCRVHR